MIKTFTPKNNNWIYLVALIVFIVILKNIMDLRPNIPLDPFENIEHKENLIESRLDVDSSIVVVDSPMVQVDSLHQGASSPIIKYVTITKFIEIPLEVDTSMIINNYFKNYSYLIQHTNKDIDLKVKFDYSSNKIYNPKLEYKILRPTKISYRPLRGWFYGGTVGGSLISMHQITPEIMYINNNKAYKIGYNLIGGPGINVQLGYYVKL